MAITAADYCSACGWVKHDDGTCRRCAERAVVVPPCPPHTQWPREFKGRVFDLFLLEASQNGRDDAERRQRTWEAMLHLVAGRLGVRRNWMVPAGELYARLTEHFNRPTSVGKDA